MIVEDNPSDLLIMQAVLKKQGLVTIDASNGFEGLERLDEFPFELFVVDLMMASMGGLEFIRRMRRNPKYEFTPVLIISSRSEAKDIQSALKAGATDYVVKPLDPVILENKIKKILGTVDHWEEYNFIDLDVDTTGTLSSPLTLKSVSEVALSFESSVQLAVDKTYHIESNILKDWDLSPAQVKVLHCEKYGLGFQVRADFVGVTPKQRHQLRLLCKKLWSMKQALINQS